MPACSVDRRRPEAASLPNKGRGRLTLRWHDGCTSRDVQHLFERGQPPPAPVRASRWHRPKTRLIAAIAIILVVLAVAVIRWTRLLDDQLRAELEAWLSDRLASDVRVEQVTVTLLPRVHVEARGVTLRIRDRPDLPPFVTIGSWSGTARLSRLGIRHFDEVRLASVAITIPPRRLADIRSGSRQPKDPSRPRGRPPRIEIDRLVADRVALMVMPRSADRAPHQWDIRDLRMEPFSFDRESPFSATVDTPLPSDRAHATGTAGPWPRGDFDQLPLQGEYVLEGKLDDVPGLRGSIAVRGRALGTLDRLATTGTAHSPDAGFVSAETSAMPLEVAYEALFDATNSDVQLTRLDARAGQAVVSAMGSVVRATGAAGRHVSLHVTSPPDSSAADVLRLIVDGTRPPVEGAMAVDALVELSPGERDVLDRLSVEGTFDLRHARFLNPRVQAVLDEMSQRGQGWPDRPAPAAAHLRGTMRLSGRELALSRVNLAVPGASIAGAGRYSLVAQSIDFRGVTRLDASLSETQRGWKRWALKPFDRLVAKGGAGTRIVIDVRGTRASPVVDVDLGASLRGKRD